MVSNNTNTTVLGMSFKGNNIIDEFPCDFIMLKRSESLDLENKVVSRSIPETMEALSNMRNILFGMNKLDSTIPDSIGDPLKL